MAKWVGNMSENDEDMSENDEDEARATDRIVEVGTGDTVGFLYEWQDGSKQPLWFEGAKANVVVVALSRRCSGSDKR